MLNLNLVPLNYQKSGVMPAATDNNYIFIKKKEVKQFLKSE